MYVSGSECVPCAGCSAVYPVYPKNKSTNESLGWFVVFRCRSMAMQHRPEYQLSSQSPVLTARFHPFDTHVIIGGTYSGQVSKQRQTNTQTDFNFSKSRVLNVLSNWRFRRFGGRLHTRLLFQSFAFIFRYDLSLLQPQAGFRPPMGTAVPPEWT